jgi:hypothetical protein
MLNRALLKGLMMYREDHPMLYCCSRPVEKGVVHIKSNELIVDPLDGRHKTHLQQEFQTADGRDMEYGLCTALRAFETALGDGRQGC